jgi:nucleotide-binding universal stress UspA family protein
MYHKILVAMDTSALSKYVFNEALFLAKASKASLLLLHVLSGEEQGRQNIPILPRQDFYPYPVMSKKTLEFNQEQWEALEKQGLELLQSCTDEATLAGVSTEFIQPSGNPGQIICDVARTWGADLIVVGRQGLSGLSELVLGSVSNYVVHNASCSVLTMQHVLKTNTESAQDESNGLSALD